MKTIELNIYQFAELSESAKQKAIEWFRSCNEYSYAWDHECQDTINEFCKIFPVEWIEYDEYNIDWKFNGEDNIRELSGPRLAAYFWNNYKNDLYKGEYHSFRSGVLSFNHKRIRTKVLSNGVIFNSYYSGLFMDNCCPLTGYCMDDDILEPVFKFMDHPDNSTFYDVMNECLESFIIAIREDHEWQNSDEYIIDAIEANEYEFYESGERM